MRLSARPCTLAVVLGLCAAALATNTTGAGDQTARLKALYRRPDVAAAKDPHLDPVWQLGSRLFFDTGLSSNGQFSCASCHKPDASWSDHLAHGQGIGPKPLAFRVPTLLNAGVLDRYGWAGSFADIDAVSFFAMRGTKNMNMPTATLLKHLQEDPDYRTDFAAAFPDKAITKENVGAALTRFVGSITSSKAPFDRWIEGDEAAIDAPAKRGFVLFNTKGRCAECHAGWAFTDGSFHDIGTATGGDIGRGALFKTSVKLQYAFKTPTLRDVAVRSPYMHNGSYATLEDVIDHYDRGGIDRPSRAETIAPLNLAAREKADLIAFLQTLTSGPADFASSQP